MPTGAVQLAGACACPLGAPNPGRALPQGRAGGPSAECPTPGAWLTAPGPSLCCRLSHGDAGQHAKDKRFTEGDTRDKHENRRVTLLTMKTKLKDKTPFL